MPSSSQQLWSGSPKTVHEVILRRTQASPETSPLKNAEYVILNGCAWPKPYEDDLTKLSEYGGSNKVKFGKMLHVVGRQDTVLWKLICLTKRVEGSMLTGKSDGARYSSV